MRRECLSVAARVDVDSDGRAVLAADPAACARCTTCFSSGRTERLDLEGFPGLASLRPSMRVTLRLPADLAVGAALLLYGLPLAAILCGAALGAWAGHSDVTAVIGGGLGLGAAALATHRARDRIERAVRDRLGVDPSV